MDLSSLNMENIENILSSMSNEDMEMLSGMAQSFFSSIEQKEEKEEKKEKNTPYADSNPFSSFNIDFETLSRIMGIMERLRRQPDDPRCNLLLSLKPMLSEKRQEKIDEALKLMSLISLLSLLNEMRGDGNG